MVLPGVTPGTWCQISKVASAVSNSSARHRASELGSVHSRGQGKSMKWENSGAKDLATVLVILSPCKSILRLLLHIFTIYNQNKPVI